MPGSMDGRMLRIAFLTVSLFLFAGMSAHAQQQWEELSRLDAPRAGLSVVSLDGRVYAAGGAGLTAPRMEFESYDPEIDHWFSETSLPSGLERFGMAALNDRIYAAGGYAMGDFGVAPSSLMWSWSPEGGVWQSEVAMPGPKADLTLAALDGQLFAMGGSRDDNSIYVFDPEETAWTTIEAPEGVSRRGAASVVVGSRIYILGGQSSEGSSSRVDIFEPETGIWSRGPDLPEARVGLAAALYQGQIHIFGGRGDDQRTTLNSHFSLLPGDENWNPETDLLSPRTAAGATALESGIYVVGGGSGGGFFAPFTALDSTDVFTNEDS